MKLSTIDITNPFEIERIRTVLANKKNYKELKKFYSSKLPEIDDHNRSNLWNILNSEHESFDSPMERDKLNLVAKHIIKSYQKDIKILNVGCGSGNLEKLIFTFNNKFIWTGIDISSKSIITLKNKYSAMPNLKFIRGNIIKTKLQKQNYDVIICLEVLEHIRPSKIIKVLKKIRSALKRSGSLIISIPINENLEKLVTNGFNPNAHLRVYSKELIEAELKIADFRIVECEDLIAFRSYYYLKKLINSLFFSPRKPNGLLIRAQIA